MSISFRQEFTQEHLQELSQTPEGTAHTSVGCLVCGMVLVWVREAPESIPGAAELLMRMFHIFLNLLVEMLIGGTCEFIHAWFVSVAMGTYH